MAPLLSKFWHRSSSFPIKSPFLSFHRRYLSSKPQLIEVDLASFVSSSKDSSSSSSEVDGDGLIMMMEDFIHRLMLQKSTPDWLPFRPGSSFWVPPHNRPLKAVDFVQKLVDQLSDEESMALVTSRGWPSSAFFFSGHASEKANFEVKLLAGGMEMKVKIQRGVDVESAEDSDSDSEDQEE